MVSYIEYEKVLDDCNEAYKEIKALRAALTEREAQVVALQEKLEWIKRDASSVLRMQIPHQTFAGIVELCDAALATPAREEQE